MVNSNRLAVAALQGQLEVLMGNMNNLEERLNLTVTPREPRVEVEGQSVEGGQASLLHLLRDIYAWQKDDELMQEELLMRVTASDVKNSELEEQINALLSREHARMAPHRQG